MRPILAAVHVASTERPPKLLVIRFSSFGDIVQAIAVPRAFQDRFAGAKVDWLTRDDFAALLNQQPTLSSVISFPRSSGLAGLLKLAWTLSRAGYTHVYDAHSNLRSTVFMSCLRALCFARFAFGFGFDSPPVQFATRPKDRLRRFLFFRLRMKSVLPRPFRGADSFHRPLAKWGLSPVVPRGVQFHLKSNALPESVEADLALVPRPLIALAASAAWEMKRWPTEHWKALIELLPEAGFFLLGGPGDTFLEDFRLLAPLRVVNLAGRLSLDQSSAALLRADLVIANDTGILHVADQMNRPTIALIGPTAFGYPSHASSVTLERPLWCQPCSKDGRGGCKNDLYKRCLIEISPSTVAEEALKLLRDGASS